MNFYLPDFFNHEKLNIKIIELQKTNPEYFIDNCNIAAVYGSFPGMIWNGGRCLTGYCDYNTTKSIIEKFNNNNIPLRFTLTNSHLEKYHFFDTYCHSVLDLADNGMNGIIVNDENLEEYLRALYPNFNYVLSTTRCERNVDKINEATQKYDMVVIDYRDNKNLDFLNAIEDKNKIEILINAYCHPECPKRMQHYDLLSFDQIHRTEMIKSLGKCPGASNFYEALNFSTTFNNEELLQYIDMGFSNFKIEGRLSPLIDVIESYVYYLIKPEYQHIVRLILLKYCIV